MGARYSHIDIHQTEIVGIAFRPNRLVKDPTGTPHGEVKNPSQRELFGARF